MEVITAAWPRAGRLAALLGMVAALLLTGCTSIRPFAAEAKAYERSFSLPNRRFTYILQFDATGRLANFNTLFQAINDIKQSMTNADAGGPITNIVVVSYGWNPDIDAFESDYAGLLSNYDLYISNNYPFMAGVPAVPTAVICVSWPSGYSMIGKSLTDLVPGTTLPRTLTAPLDAAFPLSVWAKTLLADRIGYGDLQQSLGYLYYEAYRKNASPSRQEFEPNIYLIGHSFGCRVISGVIRRQHPATRSLFGGLVKAIMHTNQADLAGLDIKGFRQHIKGAVLIQPAMATANLPAPADCEHFPVLVTQSHYDHLNGVLYPIANIPFNGVDTSASISFYDRLTNGQPEPSSWSLYLRQFGFETLRIPFGIADSALLLPVSYFLGQCWEVGGDPWTWQTNYFTSTLAQVPLVKIPVQLTLNSGYHKGLFNLGRWHEAAGRLTFAQAVSRLTLEQTLDSTNAPTGLTIAPQGLQFVRADDIVSQSILSPKLDYHNPWLNFTVGQIDPIGSHDDYYPNLDQVKHPQIFDWLHFISLNSISGKSLGSP